MNRHPRASEAIAMRRAGASYSDITKKLKIGKSTLSYMLKHIQLTEQQREALRQRKVEGGRKTAKLLGGKSARSIAARSRMIKAGKEWAENNRDKVLLNIAAAKEVIVSAQQKKQEIGVDGLPISI